MNLNGFKREFAFLAAAAVLAYAGGGAKFTIDRVVGRIKGGLGDIARCTAKET